MNNEVKIRAAAVDDAQALLNIYKYYVENTAITYEYEVPTLSEFKNRISNTLKVYPYLVAEVNGEIAGYSYAGRYHSRSAYEWIAETTIYLDNTKRGCGIGQKLYSLLEDILKEQGIVKLIALITPPKTAEGSRVYNSMHFHEKSGYRFVGKIEYSGYKFNDWFSTVFMDKMIGMPEKDMLPIKSFDYVRSKFGL